MPVRIFISSRFLGAGIVFPSSKLPSAIGCFFLILLLPCNAFYRVHAQETDVPAWAYPGSATHVQVAPPPDFHRLSRNFESTIGIFQGQSDVGSAVVPGNASYDPITRRYVIQSAGYNIWYTRDEFR